MHKRWFCASLALHLVASAAAAQDVERPFLLGDPPSGDSEWYSAYDGSWDPGWDRSFTSSNAPWQLSIVAGRESHAHRTLATDPRFAQRNNFYALALLQLPLDQLQLTTPRRVGPPASSPSTSVPSDEQDEPSSTNDKGEGADTLAALAARTKRDETTSLQEAPAPEQPKESMHSELLSLGKSLLAHVGGAQGDREALRQLDGLGQRSRWSGLVPELRLRGVYGFDRSISQADSSGVYPGDSTTRGGQDSLLEARLTFRLDRLVFGDHETTIVQKKRDIQVAGQKRREAALALLSQWLDAKRRTRDPLAQQDELFEALHDEEEALLSLFVLSDGWFEGDTTLVELGLHRLRADLAELREGDASSSSDETEPAPPP